MFILSEHYTKSYYVFRKKANQHHNNAKILQCYLPAVIQRAMPSFGVETQRTQFNILSVGSGTGDIDIEIVKICQRELKNQQGRHHFNVFNRAIEPNQCSSKLYKEATAEFDNSHTTFDIRQQTFQQYQESTKEPILFDMVHFIHSLYYVDFEETVLYCLDSVLSEKGHFVCLIDDNCLIGLVNTRLLKKVNKNQQEHGLQNFPASADDWEKSSKLIKIADKLGLKHDIHSQKFLMDVTEVFDVESAEGNLLLDFLTQTVDFRKAADQQLVKETFALFEELTHVKDGKRFSETTESLVVIYK